MESKSKVKLNDKSLKIFIADRTKKISLAKKRSIVMLKKKMEMIRKDQQKSSVAETDNQIEMIMQAISFLSDVPDVYLMSLALLNQEAQSEKYANSNTSKMRAVCQFASDEKIRSAIKVFQKNYLTGIKRRKRLLSKVEANIDAALLVSSPSEMEEEADGEANVIGIAANENGKISKAEKCKAADDSICSSEKENFINLISTNATQEGFRDRGVGSKKGEELNAIGEVLAKGQSAVAGDPNLHSASGRPTHVVFDDDIDSDGEEIIGTPVANNPLGDLWIMDDSKSDSHIPGVPKDSINLIWVSSDWKKLAEAPKKDKHRPSLLRPLWLTNPEKYKEKINPLPYSAKAKGIRDQTVGEDSDSEVEGTE